MDDLLADFIAEAQDMLAALESEIVAWERAPADRERLDSIFRFFHTVKGNCGFFDFPRLERLSHTAEDVLADVRSGRRQASSALVDVVLDTIDRISAMVAAIDRGEELADPAALADDEQLIARLAIVGTGEEAVKQATVAGPASPATAPAQAADATCRPALRKRTVRLPVDLLDQIMSGVSDMVLARNDLARRLGQSPAASTLEMPFNRLSAMLDDVRDAITRTRMQSIDTIFQTYPRMVRDLAAEMGKQVLVELENGDVELDRELIEVIRDPLVHVIRNAVDHGIETPAERRRAGKREIGVLRISARQTGNEIRIGVIDDGRGIDMAAVIDRSVARGVATRAQIETMTPRQRNLLICEPGFSTSPQVTAISGRGVGMDVVRANLEQIGGSLMIDTTPGSGTRILLNVPLTLSIVPSLTVRVGEQVFALPRSYVEEVVRLDAGDITQSEVGETRLVEVRGRQVPTAALADILGLAAPDRAAGVAADAGLLVVIRLVGGDLVGLACDDVLDHCELVVRPIAPVIMQCGLYVGNTQMDDGQLVLMLDIAGVARAAGLIREVERRVTPAEIDEAVRRDAKVRIPALLFDGLDGARRMVRMPAVERIERIAAAAVRRAGRSAQVVVQDAILPLAGLPAGTPLPDPLEVLLFADGSRQVAYAIARVIDTTTIDADLRPDGAGEEARAIALIDGAPVEVLDSAALFAHPLAGLAPAAPEPAPARPACFIAGADRWTQDFLRPLVEAAGYRVASAPEPGLALAITMAPDGDAPPPAAGRVIVLRDQPDPAPGEDHTIFREDRDSLAAALSQALAAPHGGGGR